MDASRSTRIEFWDFEPKTKAGKYDRRNKGDATYKHPIFYGNAAEIYEVDEFASCSITLKESSFNGAIVKVIPPTTKRKCTGCTGKGIGLDVSWWNHGYW